MPASFPDAVKIFTTKVNHVDRYDAAHINDLQAEVSAIEQSLINATIGYITSDKGYVASGERDMYTLTVPADMLDREGRLLQIRGLYTFANNANSKRLRVFFGSTVIMDQIAATHDATRSPVSFDLYVQRIAANQQRAWGTLCKTTYVPIIWYSEPAEVDSAPITLAIKGTGVSNNDLVLKALHVSRLPT